MTTQGQRLVSLDAFRGFAIAAMVLVNNPGDWQHLYPPLAHAAWHGWTFTDTVFPFFLFIVGAAMALTLGARAAAGLPRGWLLAGHARRCAVIFALGLALNAVPSFDWTQLRIPGVLQRIALCSLLAAPLVLWCGWRGRLAGLLALLVAYTLPLMWLPVPDSQGLVAAGALQPGRDAGAWLDRLLLDGHLWRATRTWDPEGLLGTLPATATVLAGVLCGQWLCQPRPATQRLAGLLAAGASLLALGQWLDAVLMPINKNLWTPSFTVFMAGWSLLAQAAFFALLDAAPQPLRGAAARTLRPLSIYGMNALFIFVLSGLVARLLVFFKPGGVSLKQRLYEPLQALPLAPQNASLLFALGFNAATFAVAWWMWRRRWFVRA